LHAAAEVLAERSALQYALHLLMLQSHDKIKVRTLSTMSINVQPAPGSTTRPAGKSTLPTQAIEWQPTVRVGRPDFYYHTTQLYGTNLVQSQAAKLSHVLLL